jgi:hypothetical protein
VCVTRCGCICIGKRKINLSQVFSGQLVGIREVEEKIWLVSFLDLDLGYFDEKEGQVESTANPFGAKVTDLPGINRWGLVPQRGFEPLTHALRMRCSTN